MSLESLANELLLDFFEFLSITHLLHAFYGLNHRFEMLLLDHFLAHGLDFHTLSKHNVDTICRKYLPSIVDRVTSIRFSDNERPHQAAGFFVDDFTFRQFTHLRSVSLHNLSIETMNKMMLEWRYLPNLTNLILQDSCIPFDQVDVVNIVNSIWSLPKLFYCSLLIECEFDFPAPTVVSLSLKYLFISDMECRVSELARLFEHTPRLRYLAAHFTSDSDDEDHRSTFSPITTWNTWFVCVEQNRIVNILQHMPNLCNLIVRNIGDIYIDGHQWEKVVRDHLPNLKRFRLKLTRKLKNNRNWKQQFDELLNPFRSRFWLEERCWFVQCDWDPDVIAIFLYTLPYAFDDFRAHFPLISESTCPHNNCHCSYDHVRRLRYSSSLSEDFTQRYIHFSNLQDLTVYLPIDTHFWTIVPKFGQLTSLTVAWYDYSDNYPFQLQALLDRATRLYSLSIETWRSWPSQMAPFHITNIFIRRLDFHNYHYYYNNQECATLSRSPLGMQCEVLRISVKNRTCVLDLVNKMTNLRTLIVKCLDDKEKEQSTAAKDELVEWLRHQLPPTCTVTKSTRYTDEIQLWIR